MKWKTRDGTVIDVDDMSTSHLRNAVAMADRVMARLYDCSLSLGSLSSSVRGEFAQLAVEQEIDAMFAEFMKKQMYVEALRSRLYEREAVVQ